MSRHSVTIKGDTDAVETFEHGPCGRCGATDRTVYAWVVCGNEGRVERICSECDIELNALAMRFFYGKGKPKIEARIAAYARKVRAGE